MTDGLLKVVILGSTGSIGRQAVEICSHYADRIQVVALAAHSNATLLAEQAASLSPRGPRARPGGRGNLLESSTVQTVLANIEGPQAVAALAEHSEADLILNALVGAAGAEASYAALKTGKTLALANKESLVVAGELLMPLARPGKLLPVDSEHAALFQCLVGEDAAEVARLWITASGGPFRGRKRKDLTAVTPAQALAHPNWSMGAKISIDSATLMNKGLEVIEAHHLFAQSYSNIKVV